MNILYSRFNTTRRPEFQVHTHVIEEHGVRSVIKRAGHAAAKPHCSKMLRTYAESQHWQLPNVVFAPVEKYDEETIRFPFITEGMLFATQMNNAYENSETEFWELLDQFHSMLQSLRTEVPAHRHNFFKEFGEFFVDDVFVYPGCIDFNFDNLFYNKEKKTWTVIDYEWVFGCGMPLKYLVIRAVYYFTIQQNQYKGGQNFWTCLLRYGLGEKDFEEFVCLEYVLQKRVSQLQATLEEYSENRWQHLEKTEMLVTQRASMEITAVQRTEEQLQKKTEELAELSQEIIQLQEQLFTKKQELEAQKQSFNEVREALQNRIDQDRQTVAGLERDLDEFRKIQQSLSYKFLRMHRWVTGRIILFGTDILLGFQLLRREGQNVFVKRLIEYLKGYRLGIPVDPSVPDIYAKWRETHAYKDEHAKFLKREIAEWHYQPLISIVLPTYNTPREFLAKCIESVLKQVYTHWELCIYDDASTSTETTDYLRQLQVLDKRIKVCFGETNLHISGASNKALEMCRGDYIGFLDHDDELTPDALFEVTKAINEGPQREIIYSDEDFIDVAGVLSNPHFKSDWNPELLRAHNYITHFCVYKADLLEKVGGFRVGYEGAQDYDLVLRASTLLKKEQIYHIPKVLYHWRMMEGSTAMAAGEKPYTVEAGRKALQEYFVHKNIPVHIEDERIDNYYRVQYLIQNFPKVSLIIPTRDMLSVLQPCVESILKYTDYPNYEIIIVDNQSVQEQTLSWFKKIEEIQNVRVIHFDAPFNYSAINNYAISHCDGSIVGLINNDIEVPQSSSKWLEEMVSLALCPENGCIGAKLLYQDNTIQHAGVIIGLGGYAGHSHRGFSRKHPGYFNRLQVRQNLSAVTAAALLIRKEIYEEVGGLDEELVVAYNDVDFCLRVREKGYLNIYTPYAELYHYESKSRGLEDTPEKKARFSREKEFLAKRWGRHLKRDPYYNPNLTTAREDFSL